MKSLLFISASPHRRGKSLRLIHNIISHSDFQADDVNILLPHQYSIQPCTGCEYCRIHHKCKIDNDDFHKIAGYFTSFTAVVIISPIYFYHLPGTFKVMIDRFQPYFYQNNHQPNMFRGMAVLYGASRGKKLFDGAQLTLKYFLETINTDLSFCYNMREISEWSDFTPHLKTIYKKIGDIPWN